MCEIDPVGHAALAWKETQFSKKSMTIQIGATKEILDANCVREAPGWEDLYSFKRFFAGNPNKAKRSNLVSYYQSRYIGQLGNLKDAIRRDLSAKVRQ